MLQLPKSLKITRDPKEERVIFNRAKKYLEAEERAQGIHASGLLDPRQAYFQMTMPKPLTEREVWFFTIGKVLHAFVIGMVDGKPITLDTTDEGSQFSKELGITWSPDKLINKMVRELKTTRSLYAPKNEDMAKKDLQIYIEQVLTYMIASKTKKAKLWVFYINLKDQFTKRTTPSMRCYTLEISDQDAKRVKKQIQDTIVSIKDAVKQQNHRLLPLCREWKCGAANCKWFDDCKPEGRYKPLR